jgi:hypothetical protein
MNRQDSSAMRQHMKVTSVVHSARQRLWHGEARQDDNRYRWLLSDDGSSFRVEREDKSRSAAMAARRPHENWEGRCWQYLLDRKDQPAGAKAYHHESDPGRGVIWRWPGKSLGKPGLFRCSMLRFMLRRLADSSRQPLEMLGN